jgi:ribonuclease VapC
MARGRTSASARERGAQSPYVLDSWAILAWLKDEEPAATAVHKLFRAAGHRPLILCVVNLGEVYYTLAKSSGLDVAERFRYKVADLPIQFEPAREPLTWAAARLKAAYPLSYADAFAAALALRLDTHLVSGDPEFEPLQEGEGLKMRWLLRDRK